MLAALTTVALLAFVHAAVAPVAAFTVTQEPLAIRPLAQDIDDSLLEGAVSWDTLRDLEMAHESTLPGQTTIKTSFKPAILELDGKEVKLVGFIYPLEAGATHRRFLLSAAPPSCPFCLPGGATDLVEVNAATPVDFTWDLMAVKGRFAVLHDDPSGLLYRLDGARAVR